MSNLDRACIGSGRLSGGSLLSGITVLFWLLINLFMRGGLCLKEILFVVILNLPLPLSMLHVKSIINGLYERKLQEF